MTAFLQSVREARVVHDYPKELIGNMDETPMYFDMSGNTTVDMKGTKSQLGLLEQRNAISPWCWQLQQMGRCSHQW